MKDSELHDLVGTYDIIFYYSYYDDDENISRTAQGNVTMKMGKLGDEPLLQGKYEITSSTEGDIQYLAGKHPLCGEFVENAEEKESKFQLFLPSNIPKDKTIMDAMKKFLELDMEDDDEVGNFMEEWAW